MRAFNVDQPWAELIMQGRKKIEVRDWRPKELGEFAVRSTLTPKKDLCEKFEIDCSKVPKGLILGTVKIAKVITFTPQLWVELRGEHLVDGPLPKKKNRGPTKGWKLTNLKRLKSPIKAKSKQRLRGIFVLSEETAEEIRKDQTGSS